MIYSVNQLRADTVGLITNINRQIAELQVEADRMGIPIHQVKDTSNNWVLNPLLMAQAMAYNTLVMLQTPDARAGRGSSTRR